MLAGAISLIALIPAVFFGYNAYRANKSIKGDFETQLLRNAHHPGIAKQTYNAVEIILNERIPVYTFRNGRVHKFPIHTALASRKNAMLALLGNETHRGALWKDGPIPQEPILVHNQYWDKVLGNLEQCILDAEETNKNERDPRAMETALAKKEHLQTCYDVMKSAPYWHVRRKSTKRKIIIAITEIILEKWNIWETFQEDVRGNIESAKHKDCLLYTSPSPRDRTRSRMPSSA